MARYMLLIHSDEKAWADVDEAEMGAITGDYSAVSQAIAAAGAMQGGDPLEAAGTAKVVAQGGVVTDGPFAETAEQLGGYYILEVADEAAAIDWARQLPGVERGLDRIEVRAIRSFPGM